MSAPTRVERAIGELTDAFRQAADESRTVDLRGAGTLLGGRDAPPEAIAVPAGMVDDVVSYEPADLVIRVGAGMTVEALDEALAPHGQECPIDQVADGPSTLGGRIASGLGGPRAGGIGPVRDHLLGLTIVRGDGRSAHVGGSTVKNVSGFDLPRLLCGSWGTLAAIVDVTLKLRPRPRWSGWYATEQRPDTWPILPHAPVALIVTPDRTYVALEGHPRDAEEEAAVIGLEPSDAPMPVRGARISVASGASQLATSLGPDGWMLDALTGVIHLDTDVIDRDTAATLAAAAGGTYLDLSHDRRRVPGLIGHVAIHERLRDALDPHRILAPWRLTP